MAATIRDIAKKLNISISTVSYALNGGPRLVPDHVRDRVLAVAREINYRPNRLAKSMITGRTDTIGIILPEIADDIFLGPFVQLTLNGIANEAGHRHQDLLIYTRKESTDTEDMLTVILDGRADGVIFLTPTSSHQTIEIATNLHIPCVAISGSSMEGVTTYSADNVMGMHEALDHLWGLGHRKIAHIAGRMNMHDGIQRLQCYKDFLARKDAIYREEYVRFGQFLIQGGSESFRELMALPDPPTAIMCANDEMAIGSLMAAHDLGIVIPDQVSLVGFDKSLATQYTYPPLTTVRQPISEIGTAALGGLLDLIEGKTVPQTTILPTLLEIRSTTKSPTEDMKS